MIRTYSTLLKIIVLIVLVFLIGMGAVWLNFLYKPIVTNEEGLRYTVREGTSLRAVIDDLYLMHVVNHPDFFKLLIRIKGVAHQLKAGEYLFKKGTNPSKMLDQLITGNGMVYRSFTIIPGKTFKEVRSVLASNDSFKHTIDTLTDNEIMTQLGHPNLAPEGEFFPDTYFFVEGTQDIVILNKAFTRMQEKLNKAWQKRMANLPFKTPYQALIAASIIEKEAYFEDELPKIAGVMINRMRKNMLLQFDPTVIYGVGEQYTGKIRQSDLINKNAYNTYVHKGLPPTPISMPSLAAITAVLHPAKHDYYYFVAQKDKSSLFSQHLSEHDDAVESVRKAKGFFNTDLTRYYLIKVFSQNVIISM